MAGFDLASLAVVVLAWMSVLHGHPFLGAFIVLAIWCLCLAPVTIHA
jgi:hypothetical protein